MILVLSATFLYLCLVGFQLRRVAQQSYRISENEVGRIDSVVIRTRAYHYNGSGKGSSRRIEFDDTKGNEFRLEGSAYSATENRRQLYDTLQYYGTSLSIYVLKDDLKEYYDDDFDRIEIYGLEIGEKAYLSLHKLNNESYGNRFSLLIFGSICYFVFLLVHVMQVRKNLMNV